MSLFPPHITVEVANTLIPNTLMETIGITFTHVGDTLEAIMPVDKRTHQPIGLLHGGASIALAETIGSSGSAMLVDITKYAVVGLNMQANHMKSVREGMVTGVGKLIHKGRSTHIWDIEIIGPNKEIISLCRLTNFIKPIG